MLTRRHALAGFAALPITGRAASLPQPASVVSIPARDWRTTALQTLPDPDILILDPSFTDLLWPGGALTLHWTTQGWLEGPAWSNEGRFLLLSDTMASKQYRFLPDEGPRGLMTTFRRESFHANGNTFDAQGRLITCEHGLRRVIRWEPDGTAHVLADRYNGLPLNSPNDIVVRPDGAIWFTDPAYGDGVAEGHADAPGSPANPHGALKPGIGDELSSTQGGQSRQTDHVFRINPVSGALEAVLDQNALPGPNGLCFSPDGATLYVISSGPEPTPQGRPPQHNIHAFDMREGRPANGRIFTDFTLDGHPMIPDGIRADGYGNLWCGASGPLGLCGVFVFAPSGHMIGRLRLPTGCSNLTFGGERRNVLFMCCGGALFSLITATQGAGYS